LNLQSFCATNLWKGQYTKLDDWSAGTAATMDFGNTSLTAFPQEAQMSYLMHAEQDPQGQGFVYVAQPTEWIITRSSSLNDWICTKSPADSEAGLYLKSQVMGDAVLGSTSGSTLVAQVLDATGNIARELVFNTEEELEVPPDNLAGANISDILQTRQSISVVLNVGESCLLPSGPPALVTTTDVAVTAATSVASTSPAASSNFLLAALSGARFSSGILSWALVTCTLLMTSIAFN
jgi:hypothetical protein